jgi:hypothetical protein
VDKQSLGNNLVIVVGVFGTLLMGMLVLELLQPMGRPADGRTAAAPEAPKAEPAGGQQRPAEPAKPRKLEVRAELFEKCHRAFVEWKGSTDTLRKEMRLIEFKVKDGDEKKLLELFKQAVTKLECKSIIVGLGGVAEKIKSDVFSADATVRDMALKTPMGADAVAWRDRRVVRPTEQQFDKLKKEIPDLEIIDGYIPYAKALEAIDQQILVLEAAIGVGLSG